MADIFGTLRHALPRERRLYASVEATYGTRIQPAGADALRVLSAVIGSPQPTRVERVDNRQTRSIENRITGNTPPIEWSAEGYLIPSGTAGTAPDMGAILKAAFGTETIVGGTSVTYELSDVQQALGSLTLTDELSGGLMESLAGAIVQELTIRGSGGDPPMMVASGVASSHVLTGRTEISSAAAAVITPVVPGVKAVEVGSRGRFMEADGTTVRDDNGGAGFVVLSETSTTFTVDAAPAGVVVTDIWEPFVITEVTAGSPTPGIVGSVTLDSLVLPVTSWEFTLSNNLQPHADEAFQANATGYHEGDRQVTGQVTLRARFDQILQLEKRKDFAKLAMTIVVGSVVDDITTITFPGVELNFANVDKAQPETAMITLPFQALGTGDEVEVAFT